MLVLFRSRGQVKGRLTFQIREGHAAEVAVLQLGCVRCVETVVVPVPRPGVCLSIAGSATLWIGEWTHLSAPSAAHPVMSREPAGEVLTTSDLESGQQYVLISAVVVQLSEARAPEAAPRMTRYFILV